MEFLGTRQESKDEEDGSKNSNRSTRKGLPVHLQEVRDERGRQRLHGAFQGGFSAGYYNTVGSKEGWAPKQFKSGRNVQKDSVEKMNPFDFMDADDIQEFGKGVMGLKEQFNELGSTERELKRKRAINDVGEKGEFGGKMIDDLVISVKTQMIGERLLSLMKQSSKRAQDGETAFRKLLAMSADKSFASSYGRGFDPLANAPEFQKVAETKSMQHDGEKSNNNATSSASFAKKKSRGFGTGIFENEDEDFDEPVDTRDGFNKFIGEDDDDDDFFTKRAKEKLKSKQPPQKQPSATRPGVSGGRKGGILDGFVSRPLNYPDKPMTKIYVAPFPPADWEPVPSFLQPAFLAAKAAEKEEEERRKIGAKTKVSIYSYLNTKSKERLDAFLSQASGPTPGLPMPPPSKKEPSAPLPVYSVPTKVAEAALKGFMPFGNDLPKQARYKRFLEDIIEKSKSKESSDNKDPPKKLTDDEANETREFSKAAMIYRPLSNMIASRFTNETGEVSAEKEELPPVRMVRTITKWKPSKLTSRRFGVVHQNDSDDEKDKTVLAESKQALNPETMKNLIEERDKMLQEGEILSVNLQDIAPTETITKKDMMEDFLDQSIGQKEELLEVFGEGMADDAEKPSLDLFKAIFADSDDDSDQEEQDSSEVVKEEVSKKGNPTPMLQPLSKPAVQVHEVKVKEESSTFTVPRPPPSSSITSVTPSATSSQPSAITAAVPAIRERDDSPASYFKGLRKDKDQVQASRDPETESTSMSSAAFKPVFSGGAKVAGNSKTRPNAIVGARKKKAAIRVVSYADDDDDAGEDANERSQSSLNRTTRPSAADFM